MKIAAKLISLTLLSAAVLVTGCSKKPLRPIPDNTMLGPGNANASGSNMNVQPTDVSLNPDAPALTQRDGVYEDENVIKGLLKDVYFDYDKSAVKQSERSKLEAAAAYLKEHPQHRLLLEGHCDWRGTAEYNMGLGERRAGAAKQLLVGLGVELKRLETSSKGSLESAKNGSDEQMGKDRKAALIILKK